MYLAKGMTRTGMDRHRRAQHDPAHRVFSKSGFLRPLGFEGPHHAPGLSSFRRYMAHTSASSLDTSADAWPRSQ